MTCMTTCWITLESSLFWVLNKISRIWLGQFQKTKSFVAFSEQFNRAPRRMWASWTLQWFTTTKGHLLNLTYKQYPKSKKVAPEPWDQWVRTSRVTTLHLPKFLIKQNVNCYNPHVLPTFTSVKLVPLLTGVSCQKLLATAYVVTWQKTAWYLNP